MDTDEDGSSMPRMARRLERAAREPAMLRLKKLKKAK
jgi:hypothetical protein